MKRIALLTIVVLVVCFSSCRIDLPEITTDGGTEEVSSEESTQHMNNETTSEDAASEATTSSDVDTTHQQTDDTSVSDNSADETTTQLFEISSELEEVISMPEKNGTMVTDSKASNKYIKIINKERKIDTSLLVAVYSVPESGQNYVFEFYNSEERTKDNIRRVYLINNKGKIESVAAADASEKENISSAENWFCMNVLIKEVIFPAVENDMK